MRVVIKFIFKIFAIIMYRPKILGKENLPEEGGALLCPNHVHNLDAAIIVAMFKRKVNVLAKEELFKNKFLCWIADLFGIYPVKREKADMQAIKISLKLLKAQIHRWSFPLSRWKSSRVTFPRLNKAQRTQSFTAKAF